MCTLCSGIKQCFVIIFFQFNHGQWTSVQKWINRWLPQYSYTWSQHQQISGDSFEWNLLKMFCVYGIPNRFALIMFWIQKFKENLSFHKFHMKNAIRWFNFRKHLPQNTEHRPKYEKTPATIVHTPYISSSSVKFQQYSSVSYRHNVYGRQQKCKISIFSLHWAIELKVSH